MNWTCFSCWNTHTHTHIQTHTYDQDTTHAHHAPHTTHRHKQIDVLSWVLKHVYIYTHTHTDQPKSMFDVFDSAVEEHADNRLAWS